jgi:glycosyltransferase involved in cell wall biosynthesis
VAWRSQRIPSSELADQPRSAGKSVSLVVPTYQRVEALKDTLPSLLAVENIDEVLFIDDGSTDDTAAFLSSVRDPRVRYLRQPVQTGLPAARNRGLVESTGEWIVFGEDDVRLPSDYVTVLLEEARANSAEIVGAPFLLLPNGEDALASAVAAARARCADSIVLDQQGAFPAEAVKTPFLPARALIHRSVVDAGVRFDEGYRGNAYREETDFFVHALRSGFTSILTPRTLSYQVRGWQGGVHTTRHLIYEYWAIRNTWRFLARHGRWLHRQGLIDGSVRTGLRFMAKRIRTARRSS